MGSKNPERYPPSFADHLKIRDWAKDNPAWGFAIDCERCVNAEVLLPKKLMSTRPDVRRIGDMKARLVCEKCGSRFFRIHPAFLYRRD